MSNAGLWKLWRIDFSSAFRLAKNLKDPKKNLVHCDGQLFEKLKTLDENELAEKAKHYLTKDEMKVLMPRRDKIVAHFSTLISEKGENKVLYKWEATHDGRAKLSVQRWGVR